VAAQILELGAFDSTNSAQIIEPSPGIGAVMVDAGVTDVSRIAATLMEVLEVRISFAILLSRNTFLHGIIYHYAPFFLSDAAQQT